MKRWRNVELNKVEKEKLMIFCKENGIYAEPSIIFPDLYHIEIKCTEEEEKQIREFIDTL